MKRKLPYFILRLGILISLNCYRHIFHRWEKDRFSWIEPDIDEIVDEFERL
jgi:hypothetical protein